MIPLRHFLFILEGNDHAIRWLFSTNIQKAGTQMVFPRVIHEPKAYHNLDITATMLDNAAASAYELSYVLVLNKTVQENTN